MLSIFGAGAGKVAAHGHDEFGADGLGLGKGQKQRLIGEQVIENASKEGGITCTRTYLINPRSGQADEGQKPVIICGQKAKCLNCQGFCRLARGFSGFAHIDWFTIQSCATAGQ